MLSNLGDFAVPAVSGKPVMESERFGEIYGPYPSVRFPVSSHSSMYYIQQIHRTIEFDYSVARQKLKGIGPIPEGEYWFNVKYKRNWRSFVSHIVGREGWGDYSWSLTAEPSTMVYGRSVFFIHGGLKWGSAGCIDIKDEDATLSSYLLDLCDCYIPVIVKYPENLRVTQHETYSRIFTYNY